MVRSGSEQRLRVVDVAGRAVGIYEYGDPAGRPVFALHGTPACGAGFGFADGAATELGLRLVAPDRPGVGLSARSEPYVVADYVARLAELADELRFDEFAVWGYSGGGPYAAACAALLPDRVQHAAIASGMGQVGRWAQLDDFEQTDRQMLGLVGRRAWLARIVLGASGRAARFAPGVAYASFAKQLSASDRSVAESLGGHRDAMELFTRAFLRGSAGVVADYAALAQPWGVDVAQTRTPMTIWHGDQDPMVPLAHSEALAALVPHARLTVWPGEGHLGPIAHVDDILAAIASDIGA
jgi:pimeloyl-ACP methyl ester carboxylesterase